MPCYVFIWIPISKIYFKMFHSTSLSNSLIITYGYVDTGKEASYTDIAVTFPLAYSNNTYTTTVTASTTNARVMCWSFNRVTTGCTICGNGPWADWKCRYLNYVVIGY